MEQLTLGQRISARRKLMNLSQEAVAERLEVSRQAVSKWESDRAVPEIDKLIALGRLFEVSVGWLLGTERDPEPGAEPGFSQQQLETLEELFYRDRPRKRMQMRIIAAGTALAVVLGGVMIWASQRRLGQLAREQAAVQEQLTALAEDNRRAEVRLDELNAMLEEQAEASRLISDLLVEASAGDDLQSLSYVLYLTPKVYQESCTAYLSVENPSNGFNAFVPCVWNGVQYVVRDTIPLADGYRFSFLLVNDYGYEEENLGLRDPGFALLGTYSGFHLAQEEGQCGRLFQGEAALRDASDRSYVFCAQVHTPHIFGKTAIAYQDVTIALMRNGEVLWSRSYLEELEALFEGLGSRLNAADRALQIQIEQELPELAPGDRLELVLTAQTVNGGAQPQTYITLLDVQEVG